MAGRSLGISTVTLTVTTVTNRNSFACVFSVARFFKFCRDRYKPLHVDDGYGRLHFLTITSEWRLQAGY